MLRLCHFFCLFFLIFLLIYLLITNHTCIFAIENHHPLTTKLMKTSTNQQPKSLSQETNIIFYSEWYEAIYRLPDEIRQKALDALFMWAFKGVEPKDLMLHALLSIMMSTIKRTRSKYEMKEARKRGRKSKGESDGSDDEPEIDDSEDDDAEMEDAVMLKPNASKENDMLLRSQFDAFRREYPGAKRGLDVEFNNLKARTGRRWREVVPQLMAGLSRENLWREQLRVANRLVPAWQSLQAWINNSKWEMEYGPVDMPQTTVAHENPEPRAETRIERERRERREHEQLMQGFRDEYRRRIPGAMTDAAPLTFAQYLMDHCNEMSDEELSRFIAARV